jgi:hypothetical protein
MLVEAKNYRASGQLTSFSRPSDAYWAVCLFEPSKLYRWAEAMVEEVGSGREHRANVLMALEPESVARDENVNGWSSARDPLLIWGLPTVRSLLGVRGPEIPGPRAEEWDRETARGIFTEQGALLLLSTVAERYAALKFGPSVGPMAKMRLLGRSEVFEEAMQAADVEGMGRRVMDGRDPGRSENRPPQSWYQVRSNLSHRGKAAFSDIKLVRRTVCDFHNVMRRVIAKELPAIRQIWEKVEPDGHEEFWHVSA